MQGVKQGVNAPADLWEAADGLLHSKSGFITKSRVRQSRAEPGAKAVPAAGEQPARLPSALLIPAPTTHGLFMTVRRIRSNAGGEKLFSSKQLLLKCYLRAGSNESRQWREVLELRALD